MNVNKFLQSSLVLYFLFYLSVHAQTWEVNPDYWTATDNLGRTTPTENQTGAVDLENMSEFFILPGTRIILPIFLPF